MRLLIRDAELFDGVRETGRTASVLVEGVRVSAVFEGGAQPEGYEGPVLDAGGLCLCPGFIDTHSHNDFYATQDGAERYLQPFVRQGITTQVAGQCGFSTVGINPDTPYGDDLFAFFMKNPRYPEVSTFEGWKAAVDERTPLNLACFAGHGTLRTALRGLGPGPLTPAQLDELEARAHDAMVDGAAGLSFGLMYDPGMFAPHEELVRLAKVAARLGKPISFHARALSRASLSYPELLGRPHNLRALDEIIDIARQSGAHTHISHLIFVGRKTWPTLDEAVAIIDSAATEGLSLSFDIYPFDFGASTVNVALPSWYQGLTAEEKAKGTTRLRLRAEILATTKLLGFGFEDIQITWAGHDHPEYIGRRISQIAKSKGMGRLETYLDIVEQCGPESTVMMYTYMNDAIIDALSRHPQVHYMTDAWIAPQGMQNPAAYQTFPKLLRLSREGRAEALGRLIVKATGGAAARFGLKHRGRVQPEYFADLVLFDRHRVAEGQGEGDPVGIPYVMVNGEFAVREGDYYSNTLGRALRVE